MKQKKTTLSLSFRKIHSNTIEFNVIFTFIQIFNTTMLKLFKLRRSKQLNNGIKIFYIRRRVKNILNLVSG